MLGVLNMSLTLFFIIQLYYLKIYFNKIQKEEKNQVYLAKMLNELHMYTAAFLLGRWLNRLRWRDESYR